MFRCCQLRQLPPLELPMRRAPDPCLLIVLYSWPRCRSYCTPGSTSSRHRPSTAVPAGAPDLPQSAPSDVTAQNGESGPGKPDGSLIRLSIFVCSHWPARGVPYRFTVDAASLAQVTRWKRLCHGFVYNRRLPPPPHALMTAVQVAANLA